VASAPAAFVRVWHLMSRGRGPRGGRPLPEVVRVAYPRAAARSIAVDGDCVVYTTLGPCNNLPTVNDGVDCPTILLEAGLRHVVFAASSSRRRTRSIAPRSESDSTKPAAPTGKSRI
jgi:hypothetical protein